MSSPSSGKRCGEWDKSDETRSSSHDVGLGLRLQQQQQHHQLQLSPSSSSSSSGGRGGLKQRMAFTANQREELERQTMIYKYMMASMPVPSELIIPLSNPNDHSASPRKGLLQLRYNNTTGGRGGGVVGVNNGGDAEPWRCKRTDGKKWRCSRDVAPDQKYCERHSHKGRPSPRSRKPVESSLLLSSSTSTTTAATTTTTAANPSVLNHFHHHSYNYDPPSSLPQFNNNHTTSSSLRYPQCWFMKDELLVPSAQVLYPQQLQQQQHFHAAENSASRHFSPTTSPSDQTTRPLPHPFIDAWSLEDVHKVANASFTLPNHNSSSMNSDLPLTLSMSAGFNDPNLENDQNNNNAKEEDSMSLRGIRSWVNLPSGGPLAEALCLGMSGTTNAWATHSDELVSPNGHSTSSTSTTMSSKGSHASGDTGCQGFRLQ